MTNQEEAIRVIAAALAINRLNKRIDDAGPHGASVGNHEEASRLAGIRREYDNVIESLGAWDS